MGRYLGIAGIQMRVFRDQDNSDAMIAKLHMVSKQFPWVDLVFFSELCACGLSPDLAISIPNPTIDKFCAWAKREKKWLIPGSVYEREQEKVYNTSIVISPDGEIITKYRKLFPWAPSEQNEGGESFCVFDIPKKGRIGLCICYDQWFPEVIRTLAWMGAEAVIHPTATCTSDRALELVLSQANAISNQVYFLSVNGVEGGGIGQSIFVDPEGHVLQTSGEGEMILTEVIDLDMVSRVREYGTLGLCQVWKSLGNFGHRFPIYMDDIRRGEIFKRIGKLEFHRKVGDILPTYSLSRENQKGGDSH
jgi:predicted amidohydrolase